MLQNTNSQTSALKTAGKLTLRSVLDKDSCFIINKNHSHMPVLWELTTILADFDLLLHIHTDVIDIINNQHTHTHTHTCFLSLSHTHKHIHALTHMLSLSLSLSLSHTHTHTHTHMQTDTTHTHASSLSLSLSLSHTHIRTRKQTLHTNTHTHTTSKMVGLHPTMKGRWRNPAMRWAIRTGSSLLRYWALRCKLQVLSF